MFVCLKKFIAAAFMGCVAAAMFWAGVGAPRAAHADEIVNVEYIVGFVKNKWGVDVPYVPAEIHWAANVEYLLKVVDYVNGKLNNGEKTNYGESEYATKEVVDTIAANQAIRTLIKKKAPEYKFFFTPAESNGNEFKFWIGAKGTFYIDWDDGTTKTIEKTEFGLQEISHEYADAAANHTIKLGGTPTEYLTLENMNNDFDLSAITFINMNTEEASSISSIDGCLGCVFPTLANGAQPIFLYTFAMQEQLKTLPSTLFDNIHDAGYPYMFGGTFAYSGIRDVPDNLFDGVRIGRKYMFGSTFFGCSDLTSVGDNWFANMERIEPEGGVHVFDGMFEYSGLETVGDGWFAKLTNVPEGGWDESVFYHLFLGADGLKSVGGNWFGALKTIETRLAFAGMFRRREHLESIGDGWFANLETVNGENVFYEMFYGTSSLKTIPPIFKNIKTGGKDLFSFTFENSGLTSIPEDMFAGLTQVNDGTFSGTFSGCSGLTSIPEHLFDGIDTGGSAKTGMFSTTFADCTSLTGPSARINGRYLYEIWPDASSSYGLKLRTYENATGLSDYECIPENWGGPGTKNPGECPIPETE